MSKIIFAIVIVSFLSFPIQAQTDEVETLARGRVLAVLSEDLSTDFGQSQILKVEITSGPNRGQFVEVENFLSGHPLYDVVVSPGSEVLLVLDEIDGQLEFNVTDHLRDGRLLTLLILFIITVLAVGGKKGLKALITIFLIGVVIIKLLLPLLLAGFNPIISSVALGALATTITLGYIGGLNRKTYAAIIGTAGGLLCAGILALIVGKSAQLTGLSSAEAQSLQFLVNENIDFQGLLFAGIIIGALGAILDVGMSVSSAMEEIRIANPKTPPRALFHAGMRVGRDILGTMTNTLILAYLGGSMPLLLLFSAYDTPFMKLINLDMVASEVIRALSGTIGLTVAVPLTALVASWLLVNPTRNN